MKACAHLGFQFNEFAGLERIEQAALAGFQAAEWPGIFELDRATFLQTVRKHSIAWPQVTLPLGNAAAGEKGITALPGRDEEFQAGLSLALSYAQDLNAPFIHPMSGVNCPLDDAANRSTYVRRLKLAVQQAQQVGRKVLIEVISPSAVPGYAMSSYDLAQSIMAEIPQLYLLLDTYHAALIDTNPVKTIERFGARIGHVQVADFPGRHEPGTGALDFASIMASLEQQGYTGYLGCEYKPQSHTLEGLQHLRAKGWL